MTGGGGPCPTVPPLGYGPGPRGHGLGLEAPRGPEKSLGLGLSLEQKVLGLGLGLETKVL